MPIPTEPIGSIPRPPALLEGLQAFAHGHITQKQLDALYDAAIRDTIERFEATGSPVEENKILGDLDKENTDLRDALKAAQEANTSLRAKAEMAERLAEMVYGKAP